MVKIYATDIEMLIRNPYGFYSKKILSLRDHAMMNITHPNVFGHFVHHILATVKDLCDLHEDNYDKIINNVINNLFATANITQKIKPILSEALRNIMIAYHIYTKTLDVCNVFKEIEGSYNVYNKNCDKHFVISAIADRIEVHKNNLIRIVDFKTGAAPVKSDVLSGISPQLLIEAIILSNNGFDGIHYSGEKIALVYIKLSSNKQYVEEVVIDISHSELEKHFNGLMKLLEHYFQKDISEDEMYNIFLLKSPKILQQSYNPYNLLQRL